MWAPCPQHVASVEGLDSALYIFSPRAKAKAGERGCGHVVRPNGKLKPTRGRRYEVATPASHVDTNPSLPKGRGGALTLPPTL
eukprot:10128210-Alexandrium_andersonii.AAC.1